MNTFSLLYSTIQFSIRRMCGWVFSCQLIVHIEIHRIRQDIVCVYIEYKLYVEWNSLYGLRMHAFSLLHAQAHIVKISTSTYTHTHTHQHHSYTIQIKYTAWITIFHSPNRRLSDGSAHRKLYRRKWKIGFNVIRKWHNARTNIQQSDFCPESNNFSANANSMMHYIATPLSHHLSCELCSDLK